MKRIIFFAITTILLFSVYGSFNLSLLDFQNKGTCPKVLGIPACYIVCMFFVLALVAHIFKRYLTKNIWYYGFMSVPFLLALGWTLTELSGEEICPRTPGGTPMCFISLAICGTLLLLKYTESRMI